MLPIESECVQRAIFAACRTNAASRLPRPRAGAGWPGSTRTGSGETWPLTWGGRPAGDFLALDEAVTDSLGGGQRPASARVFAYLIHLTACYLGQPEVQRVEHACHLLLAGGEGGHRATEMQPGLGELEGGVRVTGPERARDEHAEGGTADLSAHAGADRDPQHIENPHDCEGGGQVGPQVLQ